MKKILAALLAAFAIFGLSGCFPVFVPVGDHDHGHDRYRERGHYESNYDHYRGDRRAW